MPGGKLNEAYISTCEAGVLLGSSPKSIETGLRNGTFPIGVAWHTMEDGRRGKWHYRIPREALIKAIETGSFRPPASCETVSLNQ